MIMIEIRKEKSIINPNGEKVDFFETFIDNEIIAGAITRRWDNGEIDIELNRQFDFEQSLKKIGQCDIDNLVNYENKAMPFSIYIFGEYQEWEKIFFSHQTLFMRSSNDSRIISFEFRLHHGESSSIWVYKYSQNIVFEKLSQISNYKINITVEEEDEAILFRAELKEEFITTLSSSYKQLKKAVYEIEQVLYLTLEEGFEWKEDYHTDEPKFTREVMIPLLNKMKYKKVRYNHGPDEHGKDVIFSEINKFGKEIFYAVQVKAGDISGEANSQIDKIIGQLDDAFCMPFKLLGNEKKQYISFFVIVISGKFTKNAKEKMLEKVPKQYKQHIFFWDKDKIEDLTGTYCYSKKYNIK